MSNHAMMNAPAVFVPTQPESDGLTLPTLLSLLAHGLVGGLLIYNLQSVPTENVGSIETIMVSPEQLAEMQSQILANQASASEGTATDNLPTGEISTASPNPRDFSNTDSHAITPPNTKNTETKATATSQKVPVLLQSNDTETPNAPLMISQEQQNQLAKQADAHDRTLAEWNAEQEAITNERLERVEQDKQDAYAQEQEQLKEFKDKESTPPKVEKPNNQQRNIEISAGNAGKNYNLSNGQSTLAGENATSNPVKGSSSTASSGSRGTSNSEIIGLIKRNYTPPVASKGSTQRATLTITINANGDVIKVVASGSNKAVNDAAKQAVMAARNLPIDTDDSKYPTFTLQFNGSN